MDVVDENIPMMEVKDKVPSPSPFFNVYIDSKSSADTAMVIGGGVFRNKPLAVIGGDDSSSNILRKYGSNLGHDDSNVFRKPSSNNKNIRKRPTFEDEEDSKGGVLNLMIIHNNKTNKRNPPAPKPTDNNKPLHFSTGHTTKSSSSSSSLFQFQSSIQIQNNNNNATATLETETEFSKDSRSIRERVLKQATEAALLLKGSARNKRASSADDDVEKPLYKGIHGYTDYRAGFRREQTVSSEKASGAHGPLRASAHIRVSARFDYQPDVCKDYKETGYCGFGDSCKFLHDRGDYKSGWQMEADWNEAEKVRKRDLALGGGNDVDEAGADQSDDDALPFACSICRGPFVDAVVTTCKHYFCEHCALKHIAKNKECFVCNKRTFGIFNTAQEIRKKMAAEGTKVRSCMHLRVSPSLSLSL